MGEIYQMTLPVEPVGKGRPRAVMIHGHLRNLTPEKTRRAEKQLQQIMRSIWKKEPLKDPLSVSVCFMVPRPKTVKRAFPTVTPDLDNLLKTVMDAANKILWVDDCQIVQLTASKIYGSPKIILAFTTMSEQTEEPAPL